MSNDAEGRASIKAALAMRLTGLLGGRNAGNGTPLADVVACAIAERAQDGGAGVASVAALEDTTLLEAAENLHRHLNGGSPGFALPFGTKVEGPSVEIAGQRLLLDAGRPGLHPFETIRQDAHGPNLVKLLALLETRAQAEPFRKFGAPRAATIDSIGADHCIEFPPLAQAGGVTLRHSVSQSHAEVFCSLLSSEVEDLAADIANSMDRLWQERSLVGSRVREVRRAVLAGLALEIGATGPVSLRSIAIDYTRDDNEELPYLYVEYWSLDEALRPGPVVQDVHGKTPLDAPSFSVDHAYDQRSKLRAELAARGASGQVDGLAAALIRAAPEGEQAVLARLACDLETNVTLPNPAGDLYGRLHWIGGTVHGTVYRAGVVQTSDRGLELRKALPETVMAAAVGRKLHEIVELPFRYDGRITGVERLERVSGHDQNWTRFSLAETPFLIDRATGTLRQ